MICDDLCSRAILRICLIQDFCEMPNSENFLLLRGKSLSLDRKIFYSIFEMYISDFETTYFYRLFAKYFGFLDFFGKQLHHNITFIINGVI